MLTKHYNLIILEDESLIQNIYKMDKEQQERFILNHNAGPDYQGMVVYRSTADGKVTIKKHNGTTIEDEFILAHFEEVATPY